MQNGSFLLDVDGERCKVSSHIWGQQMEKTSPRWRRQHLELPQSQCVSLQGGKKKGKKKNRNLFMIPTAGLDRVEVKTRWKMLWGQKTLEGDDPAADHSLDPTATAPCSNCWKIKPATQLLLYLTSVVLSWGLICTQLLFCQGNCNTSFASTVKTPW